MDVDIAVVVDTELLERRHERAHVIVRGLHPPPPWAGFTEKSPWNRIFSCGKYAIVKAFECGAGKM